MIRLGITAARLKLKGIDGDSHKQRIMLLNSTVTEEPHQDLKLTRIMQKCMSRKAGKQVMHGRRQFVV
jgi:hypothetical protein